MYQSKNWLEAYAVCPFYICEYKKSVTCEGYEKGIVSSLTKFESEEDKSEFVHKFCLTHEYKKCKLFKTIMEKYGEE